MFRYLLNSQIDRPGIHASLIILDIVSLGTAAEAVEECGYASADASSVQVRAF
jgi:hypothetical protein